MLLLVGIVCLMGCLPVKSELTFLFVSISLLVPASHSSATTAGGVHLGQLLHKSCPIPLSFHQAGGHHTPYLPTDDIQLHNPYNNMQPWGLFYVTQYHEVEVLKSAMIVTAC